MSIIVVEGVDGSGKSTLLENARLEIPKRYFIQTRHSCRPLEPTHITDFLKTIETSRLDVMVDRHPLISEPIYAKILRPGTDLTQRNGLWPDFESRAKRLRFTVDRIIYCRPSFGALQRNISVHPQLAGVAERLRELVDEYDEVMRLLAAYVPVRHFDYRIQDRTLEQLFFGD